MKKTLAMILAVVLMLSVLVACGGGNNNNNTTPGTTGGDDAATNETVFKLNIDYPNPENSAIYPALVQWADYVREQSGGRIDPTIYSGGALGSLFDVVTNCESGVTDGFWSGVTIYAGVFPATEVLGLPMLGAADQHVMNAVLNALITETDLFASDWENFKVVALHTSTTSPILFSKPVNSIADMAGLNLRISNAYTTEWFTQLGAAPVSMSINDGYENIQKAVVDGGLFFFDQVQSSALYEVVDTVYIGETISALTMFCLNKDVYDSMPADLQAIIDESSAFFLSLTPDIYDKQQADMIAKFEEYNVNLFYETPESREALTSVVQSSWDKWIEVMNERGYDGQKIFDTAREYIEHYNGVFGY